MLLFSSPTVLFFESLTPIQSRSKSQAGTSTGGSQSGTGSRVGTNLQGSADGGSAAGGSASLTGDSKRLPTAGSAIFASKVAPKNYLPPSDYRRPPDADEAPNCSLQLEHVYGYRGHDTRSNLFYTQTGDLVYMVGSTGIVMNIAQNSQKFFNGHTDDIVCLDLSPADSTTVCSGQVVYITSIHIYINFAILEKACLLICFNRSDGGLTFAFGTVSACNLCRRSKVSMTSESIALHSIMMEL